MKDVYVNLLYPTIYIKMYMLGYYILYKDVKLLYLTIYIKMYMLSYYNLL